MTMHDLAKQKWLEALRSGDYNQGAGYLNAPDEEDETKHAFCCLGVLCEVAMKNGANLTMTTGGRDDRVFYDNRDDLLPNSVMAWAGLPAADVVVSLDFQVDGSPYSSLQETTLAEMNDSGYTFEQIARVIEEQV